MYKVKLFDCMHELDLEEEINLFFEEFKEELISIHYSTSMLGEEDTIYSFSCMIVYKTKNSSY